MDPCARRAGRADAVHRATPRTRIRGCDSRCERLPAAAFRGHQVAHHRVLNAIRLGLVQGPLEGRAILGVDRFGPRRPVPGDERRLDVHAHRLQPVRLRERRDPGGVRAEELHLLVSDRRNRLQRRLRLGPELVPHRIELHAERPFAACDQRRQRRRSDRTHCRQLEPLTPGHRSNVVLHMKACEKWLMTQVSWLMADVPDDRSP